MNTLKRVIFFNASSEQIGIIIHPQFIINSVVRYQDGSVIAQLGVHDMRILISYGLAYYPDRISSGVSTLDVNQLSLLTFITPDYQRYPCLKLAINASHNGQALTIILNAVNEVSVAAFLAGKLKFTDDIARVNSSIVEKLTLAEPDGIDAVLEIDSEARQIANHYIKALVISY